MQTIKEIMKLNDATKIHTLLTSKKKTFATPYEECEAQYDPYRHKVMSQLHRKKKVVKVNTGKKDPLTGEFVYKEKKVDRVRVAVPIQRVIVERSVGFLFGVPVTYMMESNGTENKKQQEVFEAVKHIFKDNKLKYVDKDIARTLFKERECAELWYFTLGEDGKPKEMRVKIISPSRGDKLYPHFDEYDRMDGFSRKYYVEDENGQKVEHFDVYTDKLVYKYARISGGLSLTEEPKQHGFTKIPIIYYRQEETEWNAVQPVIERAEELLSM